MKCHVMSRESGTTMVELLVAMVVFLIFMSLAIPAITAVNKTFGDLQTKQELKKKGERVLDYMTGEIRLAGLFVGANPQVPFCTAGTIDSLEHTAGDPYDSLSFLTSEQITTLAPVAEPFLSISLPPAPITSYLPGTTTLSVNASSSDYVSVFKFGNSAAENARAFITFDTVQPTIGLRVYQVTAFGGSQISITPSLVQQITSGSNVYSVVRKRFDVNTSVQSAGNNRRNLRIVRWTNSCVEDPDDLLSAHDSSGGTQWGGVDALQFEYILDDGGVTGTIAGGDIVRVRAINIWLLVRGDFPEKDYTNTNTYTVGSSGIAGLIPVTYTPPANDHFRRVLLSKRVEVKNLEK